MKKRKTKEKHLEDLATKLIKKSDRYESLKRIKLDKDIFKTFNNG